MESRRGGGEDTALLGRGHARTHGGNTVADGAADLRNFLIDDQQESVNNTIDNGQKLVGVVADSTQKTAEYGLREYSATHRDDPTR